MISASKRTQILGKNSNLELIQANAKQQRNMENYLMRFFGIVGPGLGVMCASFVGCDKFAATLCFTLAMALMGFSYPSIRINSLDLSPNFSASIIALVNGLGSLSGTASPYVVGVLTPNRTVIEWRLVFWIMLITSVMSSVVFAIFGNDE